MKQISLKIKGILFDLDGTLVDSAPDIGLAANHMLNSMGEPPASTEQIQHWIGNGIPKLVERALSKDLNKAPDCERFTRALPIFMEYYEANVCVDSYLYPGVEQTLQALRKQGYLLGCVTNKTSKFTLPLLSLLNIDHYFTCIVSGDCCAHKKPHPEPLLFALNEMKISAGECAMIGDSINDIHAAHAAGMPAIAVSYGYNQGTDLSTHNPYTEVQKFSEILPYFKLCR